MDNWCVYMHISPNGKKYIGITSQKPEKRWDSGWGYSKHPYFFSAIKKYGWKNFQHIILFNHLTKEDACRLEHLCITLLRTHVREYGYNLSLGGECGSYGLRKHKNEQHYIDENKEWKNISKKQKEKLKKLHLEKVKEMLEKERRRKSEFFMKNNPRNREVYCLETGETYFSGAEAARQLNLTCDSKNVTRCCRKEMKSVQGYHFCYAEEKDNFDFEETKINRKKRKIYCYETNEIYESSAEAARKVLNKEDNSGIIKNCKKQQKSCCGYHFCYLEDKEGDV